MNTERCVLMKLSQTLYFSSTDSFSATSTPHQTSTRVHEFVWACVHVCLIPPLFLSTLLEVCFPPAHKRLLKMCARMRPVCVFVFCMCISAFLHSAISQPPTETDTYTVRRDENFSWFLLVSPSLFSHRIQLMFKQFHWMTIILYLKNITHTVQLL